MPSKADKSDNLYKKNPDATVALKPLKLVREALQFKKSGRALDLGSGPGRNALFLAEQGLTVTACDVSKDAIKELKEAAKEKKLKIDVSVADAREFSFDGKYDLIVFTMMSHLFADAETRALFGKIQEHTAPGGVNVVIAITNEGDYFRSGRGVGNFYPAPAEMKTIYGEWELEEYGENDRPVFDKRPGGSNMVNLVAELIARKPE